MKFIPMALIKYLQFFLLEDPDEYFGFKVIKLTVLIDYKHLQLIATYLVLSLGVGNLFSSYWQEIRTGDFFGLFIFYW